MEIAIGFATLACIFAAWTFLQQRSRRHAPTCPPRVSQESEAGAGLHIAITVARSASTIDTRTELESEDYAEFVSEAWGSADVETPPIPLTVNGQQAILKSIKRNSSRSPYVNVAVGSNSIRKTFVAERHTWSYLGQQVDASAFAAILQGIPADEALLPDHPPTSLDEAIQKNRSEARGRAVALHFRDRHGGESWRIVSGLQRGTAHLNARCHYRWGCRRAFQNERIIALVDPETREPIDVAAYLARRIDLPRARPHPRHRHRRSKLSVSD
jgi:hypothetical protein